MEQKVTKDNRYSHGKIYKIIDNTTGIFYLGQTCLRLDQRMRRHIRSSSDPKQNHRKVYQYFTSEKLNSEDVSIILLEEVNVKSKRELEKIENEYIQRELRNILCVNTIHSILDKVSIIMYHKKYDKENKITIQEAHQKYYQENNDHLQKLNKIHYQNNRDKMLDRSRKYYKENKENVLKCQHTYYEKNKDKKFAYKDYYEKISSEPCHCECGSTVMKCNFERHYNSEKHKRFMENKADLE